MCPHSFLEILACSMILKKPKKLQSPPTQPRASHPFYSGLTGLLPEGKALPFGTYHLSWLPAQAAGHPQQPRERARIGLGLVPAFPDRAREVEIAMFVEVDEGGAEGPLHGAEQVSVQDKGYPQPTGMFASPISNSFTYSSQGAALLSDRRKAALGNTFAM